MSLNKRKGSPHWWASFTVNGQRIRQSTGTEDRKQAEQYEARLKTQLWEQAKMGVKPKRLWQEAVVRWLKEQARKASLDDDKSHLRWLDSHLKGMYLDDITRTVIDELMEARLMPYEIAREKGPARAVHPTPATVNRTLEVLRAILRRAEREWDWLDRAPLVRLLPEASRRVRWLNPKEAERLLMELPPHLQDMAQFTLETGLRKSNVTGLLWSQVDMVRRCAWIHADQAKARKAIPVPLTKTAVAILRRQIGRHHEFVFTFEGKPVQETNTAAWRKALARAGIEDFRWHDLRHTWASWHAQSGTPLHVLQEMGSWESAEMVRRYAHLSGEHLLEYAERRNVALLNTSGTKLAHSLKEKGPTFP